MLRLGMRKATYPNYLWERERNTAMTDDAQVLSALSSRYIPLVLFPYYIALASQWIAAAYAASIVPETLRKDNDDDSDDEEDGDTDDEDEDEQGLVEAVIDDIVEPIKPLRLLLPRKEDGVTHWRLFVVTLSMLATSSGVSSASLIGC